MGIATSIITALGILCVLASIFTALWFLGEATLRCWGWWLFRPALRRWWSRVTDSWWPDLSNIHPNKGRSS